MKLLKVLALSLLSFVLFICLWVFGILFTVNATVLDRGFMVVEVNKLDAPALMKEIGDTHIAALPPDYQLLKQPMAAVLNEFAPSLKEQMVTATESAYDYLLGKTNQLSINISLDSLNRSLRDKLYQSFRQNLPSKLAGQPQPVIDQYFNRVYLIYTQIPASIIINESVLDSDQMWQLRMARQYIGYFHMVFWALIALMVLLIMGIILIERDVRKSAWSLGINFLLYGIVGYVTMLTGRLLLQQYLTPPEKNGKLYQSVINWLSQVLADFSALSSLQYFSTASLALGVVLIIISFVYTPRQRHQPQRADI